MCHLRDECLAIMMPSLLSIALGQTPNNHDVEMLVHQVLADAERAAAFGISVETAEPAVRDRLQLLQSVYPSIQALCRDRLGWAKTEAVEMAQLEMLWQLWLPLAMQLDQAQRAIARPLIQGILGGQGTGKTTLAAILTHLLTHLGHTVCELSIDDLYKTYADRQAIQEQDPRLKWRGPPGTHDVEVGIAALQQLRDAVDTPVALPRFDKALWDGAGDRVDPIFVSNVDIVLFEGWFVGTRPVDSAVFEAAPDPIVTAGDRQFAKDINAALCAYEPLWDVLDRLIVLSPVDYRLSKQWRQEAEQRMRAAGRGGMSDAEIEEFVTYFWRSLHPELFIQPLCQPCSDVDLVVEITADHRPGRVYSPRRSARGAGGTDGSGIEQ